MRLIDHYILVAGKLSDARKQYQRIGFNVAPDGIHPFGTHNANMYFRDGPMVETLSIGNSRKYADAISNGNTFVRNDAAFRHARGEAGFSHIVATSCNADKDHMNFLESGVSGGDPVYFTRDFKQPDGTLDTVSAKLVFARHPEATLGYFFVCEDIVVPEVDRSSLLEHQNGVLGPKRAISCSRDPSNYSAFYRELFGMSEIQINDKAVECTLPNGHLSIVTPELLLQEYGIDEVQVRTDLQHVGLIFEVGDLSIAESLFRQNKISFSRTNHDLLIVQPASDSVFFFGFEQCDLAKKLGQV